MSPNHTNAVEITISDVRAFKQCRQKWNYQSLLRLGVVPKNRAAHFAFGDLVHQALAEFYTNGADPDTAFIKLFKQSPIKTEDALQQLEMGRYMLAAYKRWAIDNDNFTVVEMEKRHTLRLNNLTPGMFFSFKYDGLVKKQGKNYLLEFKTTSNLPNDVSYLEYEDQSVAYQWAAEQVLDIPIAGVIYTFLRKKMPTKPKLLKNGQLSKRNDIITTVEAYVEELNALGFDPNDYLQQIKHVSELEGKAYFKREVVLANEYQKQQIGLELQELVRRMADNEVFIYPSPSQMNCTVCDYKHPCHTKRAGYNDAPIISQYYEKAEPRE